MSRRVKVAGAVAAYLAALLLFVATVIAVESPLLFLAAGFGVWALAIVGMLLTWSVARPKPVRPALSKAEMNQRVREISRTIDPAKRDAMWVELERDMAGGPQ